MNYETATG